MGLVCSMSFSANAYNDSSVDSASDSSYGVMPCYDYASYVSSGISANSSNKAVCSGSYYLYSAKKSVITMTLMKSTDGTSNWTAVESWSKTNTVKNPIGFTKTSTNELSSSYYYCNFVMVQIFDDNDNVIEAVSCFSNPTHL